MADSRLPGPMCVSYGALVDDGLMNLASGHAPGPTGARPGDRGIFDRAMRALEAEVANAGSHLTIDSEARRLYVKQIRAMSDELQSEVAAGHLTWEQAAGRAQEMRNTIMELVRARSTPVGRAMAEQLKAEGKTLNELIARKTQQMFGSEARFAALTESEQGAVYAQVVLAAGKSNPSVTARMVRFSRAGRGLLILALAVSVYNIATAEDKVAAAEHEGAVTGAGVLGGMAGGALAGLACGPGAPVCVTVGAFVGGALAALGVDALW